MTHEKRTTALREARPEGAVPATNNAEKKAKTGIMPVEPNGPFT